MKKRGEASAGAAAEAWLRHTELHPEVE